jgi:beta-lactamase regulating signal transducer with metallopeptidase domain
MIDPSTLLPAGAAARVAAWLLTYALHGTVLMGIAAAATLGARLHESIRETIWKAALLGALVTASLAAWRPGAARLSLALPPTESLAATANGGSAAAPVASAPARSEVPAPRVPLPRGTAAQWLVALWLAGAAIALARLGLGWMRFVRGLRRREVPADHPVHARFAALCARAGVRRRIRLTCSDTLRTPVAILRGEICLPRAALSALAPRQQEAVLAHETAHLLRGDPLWLWLASTLAAAFFFQPLLRLAVRGLRDSAEYRCDAWAADRVDPLVLARSLVDVAAWSHGGAARLPVPAIAADGPRLVHRVERLLRAARPEATGLRRVCAAAGVALAAAAAVLPAASTAQVSRQATPWSERFGISAPLAAAIERAARSEGVDPELAFRLVRTESGFDERRIGPGGIGLTQIILPTARTLQPGVTRAELLERDTNLRLGLRYLHTMLQRYPGQVPRAVQAYYQGPRQLDRRGPSPETRRYAELMLRAQAGLPAYRGPGLASSR